MQSELNETQLKSLFLKHVSPEPNSGCWLSTGSYFQLGYGRISIDGVNWRAHRLAYSLFRGDLNGLFVMHKCDNRACVNPQHLQLGTVQENSRDMVNKARQAHSFKNAMSKLTFAQLLDIRTSESPTAELAAAFLVDPTTIRRARSGRTYQYVK